MNTIEYIKNNCKLEKQNSGVISVTMCVSPIKYIDSTQDASSEMEHIKIRTSDVVAYLQSKGYTNISIVQTATIDNKQPKALTATWKFQTEKKRPTAQRTKKVRTEKEK